MLCCKHYFKDSCIIPGVRLCLCSQWSTTISNLRQLYSPMFIVSYILSPAYCPLFIAPCLLPFVYCPLFIVPCLLSPAYCPLFSVPCLVSLVWCPLLIVPCLLSLVYCPLFIVSCLLALVYCLLFIVSVSDYCPLLIVHFNFYVNYNFSLLCASTLCVPILAFICHLSLFSFLSLTKMFVLSLYYCA